jgi:hypothetical protein
MPVVKRGRVLVATPWGVMYGKRSAQLRAEWLTEPFGTVEESATLGVRVTSKKDDPITYEIETAPGVWEPISPL